jgi:hypothetical protein
MANLRRCRVVVKDIEAVVHSTEVTAESLNEAIGLALAVFRKEEWAALLPESARVQIEVQTPTVEHTVELQKWWTWLDRTGGLSPRETILRKRIRELLK